MAVACGGAEGSAAFVDDAGHDERLISDGDGRLVVDPIDVQPLGGAAAEDLVAEVHAPGELALDAQHALVVLAQCGVHPSFSIDQFLA